MLELINKVKGYTYSQRIQRVIEIHCKGSDADPMEMLEMAMIQMIREMNGEQEAVRKFRENNPDY